MEAVPAVYMYITCRIVNVDVGCELVIINAENTWICQCDHKTKKIVTAAQSTKRYITF